MRLTSVMLSEEDRIRDCYSKLERHIHTNHLETLKEFQESLGKVGMLITSYLLIHMYALIPEIETKFLSTHNKVIETILKLLEIEVYNTGAEAKSEEKGNPTEVSKSSNPVLREELTGQ